MKVSIKNKMLAQSINLLYSLSLKGKESRHRTKFINLLKGRLEEVVNDERELLKEYCHLDEQGNPKTLDNGTKWDLKDIPSFVKEKVELYEEEFVIDGGDKQDILETVKNVLLNCEKELNNEEAEVYDYLCDEFEKGDN